MRLASFHDSDQYNLVVPEGVELDVLLMIQITAIRVIKQAPAQGLLLVT